ncbi:MAG: prepilin-type N-terminal cleavage/methylation domain-containing protein [Cyanobacteriota bacterium]|nr:prepilin-type N-terminal cleavage/methylation domain-containing protein [Cyanobacteriota bacterium]
MNRSPLRHTKPRPHRPTSGGFTLVEMLVALLISALVAPLIWITIQSSIRYSEVTIWQAQLQRDLDRLTTLLDNEASEACLFGTTANPAACAAANHPATPLPTSCASASPCSTPTVCPPGLTP